MPIPTRVSADALFAEFPEWRALAREDVGDDGVPFLIIEVKAPAPTGVEHGLVIDTSNEELTVGFDCYHSHFDDWLGDGEHFGTTAAIVFIRQVLEERVAVVSWWHDDQWRGSAQMEVGSDLKVPDWASPGSFNRIRIRSWNGTYNSDSDA